MRTRGSCIFGPANAHLRLLRFRAGERGPADPPFPGGRTRTCESYIFGRAIAHLGILHFRAGERAFADPSFSGGQTRTCASSVFLANNAHLRILHFQPNPEAETVKEGPYQDRPLLFPFHHNPSLPGSCSSPRSAFSHKKIEKGSFTQTLIPCNTQLPSTIQSNPHCRLPFNTPVVSRCTRRHGGGHVQELHQKGSLEIGI